MEYIIYCDESDAEGKYFSNFYGGLLVKSTHLDEIKTSLSRKKEELGLDKELKWQRVTSHFLDKYIQFVDEIFEQITLNKIKLRIMFTQNIHVAPTYTPYHREHKYFLLYYQFIKHAFGLRYSDETNNVRIRLYLDKMPDTKEKVEGFKGHIESLNKSNALRRAGINFDKNQIAEIDSKEHILAQALDIILGAMQFRLNDKHLEKPDGANRRGKRTIAKEKLYKHINKRVRNIYPGFNIGTNTSDRGDPLNRWNDPYRHWLFKPNGAQIDTEKGKRIR